MYLPQYHCIPENDKFWGEGFTDWVTVKKARPLYKGHVQPRSPKNGYYYDLSNNNDVVWQVNLAKEHGVDGFGVYHYWFNNDTNILTTPAEIIRDDERIDIPYFLAWDNANWKRSWSNVDGNAWAPIAENANRKKGEPQILIPYILGEEPDWTNHYNYLREHFRCPQYIKIDNKPVFVILQYDENIAKMSKHWNELAKKDGYDGVCIIYKEDYKGRIPHSEYRFCYEPVHSGWWANIPIWKRALNKIRRKIGIKDNMGRYNYDKIWKGILENARTSDIKTITGAFVTYDDTPRRGNRGKVVIGSTPQKFEKYLSELIELSCKKEIPYIFLTAWNEWGEGAYLEPDEQNDDAYLKALKNAKLHD